MTDETAAPAPAEPTPVPAEVPPSSAPETPPVDNAHVAEGCEQFPEPVGAPASGDPAEPPPASPAEPSLAPPEAVTPMLNTAPAPAAALTSENPSAAPVPAPETLTPAPTPGVPLDHPSAVDATSVAATGTTAVPHEPGIADTTGSGEQTLVGAAKAAGIEPTPAEHVGQLFNQIRGEVSKLRLGVSHELGAAKYHLEEALKWIREHLRQV